MPVSSVKACWRRWIRWIIVAKRSRISATAEYLQSCKYILASRDYRGRPLRPASVFSTWNYILSDSDTNLKSRFSHTEVVVKFSCSICKFLIMESCGFAFCAKFLVFLIIGVIISTCDATYYMKKDHSLIKPYAGIAITVNNKGLVLFSVRTDGNQA